MSLARTIKCLECGKEYPLSEIIYNCGDCASKGLFRGTTDIFYDLEEAKEKYSRKVLEKRKPGVWKYTELLPILDESNVVTMGEGGTPLQRCKRFADNLGMGNIYLKNETVNPTWSFKDRVFSVNISKAVEYGVDTVVLSSSGNAATAASAYSARAGLRCFILVPGAVSIGKLTQILMYGATVVLVEGTVVDAGVLAVQAGWEWGWYQLTTAKSLSPYQGEGSKTIAYEVCEQLGWRVPDWVIVPIGGGDNLGGIWKGFKEFHEIGLIEDLPKMVGVQAEGAPLAVKAFKEGKRFDEVPSIEPKTVAEGIRVGLVPGPYPIDAMKESKGEGVLVSDEEILSAEKELASSEGMFCEPSSAATVAGLRKLLDEGVIDRSETVVCVITGAGLKDPDSASKLIGKPPLIKPKMEELKKIVEK